MHILALVNDPNELSPTQTTTLLLTHLLKLGAEVHLAGVRNLELRHDDTLIAHAVALSSQSPQMLCDMLSKRPKSSPLPLERADLILIRTNPARDVEHTWAHSNALLLLDHFQTRTQTPVLNRPSGLMRAANKLYLSHIPHIYRPKTLVSHQTKSLRDFVLNAPGPCVLKPLQGTWGTDVFKVQANDTNLNQIISVLQRSGLVCAQEYIPEAHLGDTRVLMLDGEPLIVNGQLAAVRRVPGQGDFRSNIHAGGSAQHATISEEMLQAAHAIGKTLKRDGIWFAGLDFIGHRVVEINTFSPGGLLDAERFYDINFTYFVAQSLLEQSI